MCLKNAQVICLKGSKIGNHGQSPKNKHENRTLFENSSTWENVFPIFPFGNEVHPEIAKNNFELAEKFCPRIYVDSKLFNAERKALARNLQIKKQLPRNLTEFLENIYPINFNDIVDAIFNMFSFDIDFENIEKESNKLSTNKKNSIQTKNLWLLSRYQQIIQQVIALRESLLKNRQDPRWKNRDNLRLDLVKEMESIFSRMKPTKSLMKDYVTSIFQELFPNESSPTCVIKYNVVTHKQNPNLICIQYFFYWPIQTVPHHFFDYEPVYVYINKQECNAEYLAVSFNSVQKMHRSWKTFFNQILKRPGHTIRLFFQDTSLYSQYNETADRMTKVYSGQYMYEKEEFDPRNSIYDSFNGINSLLEEDGHIALCVSNSWHSFDVCSADSINNKILSLDCAMVPLNCYDLLHIEWNVEYPFQAPFLYPTVGGKCPYMHLPIDLTDLMDFKTYSVDPKNPYRDPQTWQFFCDLQWDYMVSDQTIIYRFGKLIELLYYFKDKDSKILTNMWKKIDKYYGRIDESLDEWYGSTHGDRWTEPIDRNPFGPDDEETIRIKTSKKYRKKF